MRAFLCLIAGSVLSSGAVTALHVSQRADVEQGRSFGSAGPYERITGTVQFAVNPNLPANRIVRDLELAPRDKTGLVEFSADFYVLKPRDPARGNGTVLFEVSNRGGKAMVMHFDLAKTASRTPGTESGDLGDAWLLEHGYTLAWLGWQFDTPRGADILRLHAPVARNPDGTPIRGRVRSDFVLDKAAPTASLGDRGHQPYAAIGDGAAQLTVRDRVEDARRAIPRDQWTFAENGTAVALPGGFSAGRIYEVIYTSENPPVAGLGFAAVRDFISFLKYGGPETLLGDQSRLLKRSIGYGISQSGRFLRNFLYDGFNADEKGRIVFDGVWPHVAGAGRGNFNYRFAQPSRDARPFLNFFYPVDIFPFTDLPETDPVTGARGGLLDRAQPAPKIFYTNGSYEYWGRAASLIHTTPDSRADAPVAPNTRIYYIAGTQHGPGRLPPSASETRYPANPNDYRYVLRALLEDFQGWLKDGRDPPPSQYPRLSERQLVSPAALAFPGSTPPLTYHKAYRVDYGPEFETRGIISEPPEVGAAFPILVPQVDADGNELGGVRLPELHAPIGTYTGWNYRAAEIGAPDEMASFIGSYFPFPAAKLQERYASADDYLAKIQAAARSLVNRRLLLEQDVPELMARARQQWETSNGSRRSHGKTN